MLLDREWGPPKSVGISLLLSYGVMAIVLLAGFYISGESCEDDLVLASLSPAARLFGYVAVCRVPQPVLLYVWVGHSCTAFL